MRHHVKGGLIATMGFLSGTALVQAADLPARTAPVPVFVAPVLSNWAGFYAGSTYGYDFTHFRTREGTGASRSLSKSGQSGGGFVGYNYQFGNIVVGAEGGIDLNLVRGNERTTGLANPTHLDSLYDIRLRGRLGYAFGMFMPFVAGGAVINESYQSTLAPNNYFGANRQSVGYTIGAGVDVKVNPAAYLGLNNGFFASLLGPLVLRVEYLHDSLPNSTYAFDGRSYRTHSDSDIIRAAIIQRFGDNPPRPYVDNRGDVNWAGGYGGVFGGGGFITPTSKNLITGSSTKFNTSGAQGGLFTGTNFIFYDHYMLGVEGSTAYTDIQGNGREPSGPARFRNYINADLRARAGYAFGNYLPFASAGLAYGRSEQIDTVTRSQLGRVNNEAIEVGAGLDYRITERVSLRGEYLHEFGYNNKIINLNNSLSKQTIDGDFFRIGAAYHFE